MRKTMLGLLLLGTSSAGLMVGPAPTAAAEPAAEAQAADPAESATSAEDAFVSKINALRAGRGLPALVVHPNLVEKARQWSVVMADAGDIWHSDLTDGIVVDWLSLGENVGMGSSVERLHQAFVDSPSHFENLVHPDFSAIGIGVTFAPDGTIFVAQEFMLPRPPPEAPPPPAAVHTGPPAPGAGNVTFDLVAPSPPPAEPTPTSAPVADAPEGETAPETEIAYRAAASLPGAAAPVQLPLGAGMAVVALALALGIACRWAHQRRPVPSSPRP